jgi:hypothetical protein
VKTGKELWNRPEVGKYHATLLRTGDDKLLMLGDGGELALLDPNDKEYRSGEEQDLRLHLGASRDLRRAPLRPRRPGAALRQIGRLRIADHVVDLLPVARRALPRGACRLWRASPRAR